jgi:hypothetical protein
MKEVDMDISNLRRSPTIPVEYAGKWIAWDHEQTKIVASGRTLAEAMEAAKLAGEKDPVMHKIPKGKICYLGAQT